MTYQVRPTQLEPRTLYTTNIFRLAEDVADVASRDYGIVHIYECDETVCHRVERVWRGHHIPLQPFWSTDA